MPSCESSEDAMMHRENYHHHARIETPPCVELTLHLERGALHRQACNMVWMRMG